MKNFRKVLAIVLSVLCVIQLGILSVSAADTADYTINSPYENVIWEGDGAWGAYKGTLHSHSTFSDANYDLATMVKEYYAQGFDFLANADHGVTGVEWNKKPDYPFLYNYQFIIGQKQTVLTDEEYEGMITGTYNNRGKKMTCVVGANELNDLTLTKCHVNGYFLPEGVGTGFRGGENAFEEAVKFADENGGISHINHPGDWLDSNSNPQAVCDPENVAYLTDIILKYDSCYGIEVFNEDNGPTGYDRVLWDNMLMYALPYGKTIIGYANTDAHEPGTVDTSFMTFMMEENNVENIKATMMNGAFFSTTRALRASDFEIGPTVAIDACNTDLAYPMFTKVVVDGHKITVEAENADTLQWIANGKVISKGEITDGEYTLDLDTVPGAEDFLYVRAEIIGEGGMTVTQALTIDNGEEPLEFTEKTKSFIEKFIEAFKDSLLYVIIQEIIRAI
ncbi:MAG: hypothetical protein J6A97_07945 [Clostridia bacterium]|nr:hypothetical protein [Clostridia bacterium]